MLIIFVDWRWGASNGGTNVTR